MTADESRVGGALADIKLLIGGGNEALEHGRSIDGVVPAMTHELRSPLASVRSLSEILHDNPDIDIHRRQEFLGIIIKETKRLTSAVNHMLDSPAFAETV
ncbi:MAG: hypothetical protein GY859_33790 [Desulfobacterales bacterium]|nr:hypothetical protein [Desulfobacterales bacterium]